MPGPGIATSAGAVPPGNPDCLCGHSLGAHAFGEKCSFCRCGGFQDRSEASPSDHDTGLDLLLAHHPVFADVSLERLVALVAHAQERHFRRGDMLHRAGQPVAWVYLLVRGTVRIDAVTAAGALRVQTRHPGDFVGHDAVLLPSQAPSAARAEEDVDALAFAVGVLKPALHDCMPLLLAFSRLLHEAPAPRD